jgi:phosphoenolpyruvate carboxykinase (ATP)
MIESHRSPLSQTPLSGTGVLAGPAVHANLTAPQLLQHAIRRNEGRLSADGALIVRTGVHTGRSVQDKFVADEPGSSDAIWWGKINQKLPAAKFAVLKARVQAYLQGRELLALSQ